MVDCGSMNTFLKDQNITFKNYVVNSIIPRYTDIRKKSFLLTHFHKDHINGFKYILKENANYFDNIYIPRILTNKEGRSILLELAVFSFVFLNKKTNSVQMNISLMFIFNLIYKYNNASKIITLKSGDVFEAQNCKYEVLSPGEGQNFSTIILNAVEKIDDILKGYKHNLQVRRLMEIKEKFCYTYLEFSEMSGVPYNIAQDDLKNKVNDLNSFIIILSNISRKLSETEIAYEISEILNNENVQNEYSSMQNEFSLVFQNQENCNKNILMTGDATKEAILNIKDKLFEKYHVFKAPHHGTEGNYCKIFDNILKNHVIISNGDYHAGGKISTKYCSGRSTNHCTDNTVCSFFTESKTCCNRLCYCSSIDNLSLRCKHNGINSGVSSCNIYVVSGYSDKGCFCDENGRDLIGKGSN